MPISRCTSREDHTSLGCGCHAPEDWENNCSFPVHSNDSLSSQSRLTVQGGSTIPLIANTQHQRRRAPANHVRNRGGPLRTATSSWVSFWTLSSAASNPWSDGSFLWACLRNSYAWAGRP